MSAAALQIQTLEDEDSQWGGSSEGRTYKARDRELMDLRLKAQYFTDPCRYEPNIFRRRYRMQPWVFDRMMRDMANYDPYFVQTRDACGRLSLSTEQKLTCAMRMLAYGITADFCDDYLDIAKTTAIEIFEHFTKAIWNVYHETYLRRPTPADLRRLLDKAEERGFPGMVGSLDCMHWQWKNCPTGWAGQYTGYKGKPTIILEAVASYDTWIWHAFFGLPGSLNDINVLGCSPLFNAQCVGETPEVRYQVRNRHYHQCYYLVDGIYPKWGSFVQTIRNPRSPQTQHFTRMQEAYRKDVERAFGILQARWAIIRGPARGWSKENLQYIMMTCIILHNMIVEDERDEDAAQPFDPDDIPTRPRKAEIYKRPEMDTDVHRNPQQLNQFLRRYREVRCPVMNKNLQDDLVDHLWSMKLQADQNQQ
ncbi:protein ALP1-like [Rosa chinensis]|uniref:protein ALP1-like n=1 Tax=Rosa chinensis TaxID=74649 RepID=UPI000D08E83A|nr:protein ALP1-like [Rosa chinensis]